MTDKVYIITESDGFESSYILYATNNAEEAAKAYVEQNVYGDGVTVYLLAFDGYNKAVLKSKTGYLEVKENEHTV